MSNIDLKLHGEEMRAINAVAIAASEDSFRRVLTGVNIVGDGERVTFTATDSYRLHQAATPMKTAKFEVTVPAKWLTKTLREVRPAKPKGRGPTPPTTLTLDKQSASIANDDETRIVRLITDRYPTHQQIIDENEERPEVLDTEVMVNPKYFAAALKACEVFAGGGYNIPGARFKVTGELTPLSYQVKAGDCSLLVLLMPLRMSSYERAAA